MRKFCKEISLAFLNPKLSEEWDYEKNYPLTPDTVTSNSHKRVWWVCEKKHSYDAIVQARNRGDNCPYCSGHRVCKDNCLATINPKLVKEWDYKRNSDINPEDVTCGSHKEVWWICQNGHEWRAMVKTRSLGHGCICCAGLKLHMGNCLAIVNPKLAEEWHPTKNGKLTAYDITAHSDKKVYWICKEGHSYLAPPSNRSNGDGCPYCSGRQVCKDNCLATLSPIMAKEWDYKRNGKLTPNDITGCSGEKVWWICRKCGHSYNKSVAEKRNYPKCHNCDSLLLKNPELAREWHPTKNGKLTPKDVSFGSKKKTWWNCKKCGNAYEATIGNRNVGSGCPVCKNKKTKLKDGNICDSIAEAHYYLELKNKNINFKHHIKIGLGKCSSDFYIPLTNEYIEITAYNKIWRHWKTYLRNIVRKKSHVTKVLKAKFKFIQLKLTPKQIQHVRENSI